MYNLMDEYDLFNLLSNFLRFNRGQLNLSIFLNHIKSVNKELKHVFYDIFFCKCISS